MSDATATSSILVIGAGVFGLSTALSLLRRPRYASSQIIVLDSSKTLPNPSGSSVDASRIVRADYANPHYSRLAAQAQVLWRDTTNGGWGGEGRYHEPGFVLTVDKNSEQGQYVKNSMHNVKALAEESIRDAGGGQLKPIEALDREEDLKKATGYKHVSGNSGYVNWNSGWADAEKCVAYALQRLRQEGKGRVQIKSGAKVEKLLVENGKCVGVQLQGDEQVRADLTVLAAGAWSPSLVNLQGRCQATGQVLCYVAISEQEQKELQDRPTIINMSRGMFIIPPRSKELKIARHGYGYRNLHSISEQHLTNGEPKETLVSVPRVGIRVPKEGQDACREALGELLPEMADRPFTNTRICWYCDTPDGDFLIDYHPDTEGLFIATGGSGHGFKFFPNIGDKIVDAIEGKLQPDLKHSWRWRQEPVYDFVGCDDGSRAGRRGMILDDELAR